MISTRKLTRSELVLPELGLGCATLAFDADAESLRHAREMLRDALNNGITYFDTAPFYGSGLSERLVGDAIREYPTLRLSSKVGRLLSPEPTVQTHMPFQVDFDYTYDGIMKSVEHSYQRLGLSKIDILYCHDLGRHTHANNAPDHFNDFVNGGGFKAMEELRRSGEVSAIGLGVNEIAICEQVMEYGSFDVFLLAGRHTLLERNGALKFFEHCANAQTDIIIGGPFNSGLLLGGSTFNYRAIPEDVAARYQKLVDYCKDHNVEIGAAALQFPLRHQLVKSVIPGPKTRHELAQIIKWYNTTIPDGFWSELEQLERSD